MPGFLVGIGKQGLPLRRIEAGGGEHRRRDGKLVGGEAFEQAKRQGQRGDGPGGGRAKRLVDAVRLGADRLERLDDDRARAVGPGASDEVDQLPPAHRRIMAVARGLV